MELLKSWAGWEQVPTWAILKAEETSLSPAPKEGVKAGSGGDCESGWELPAKSIGLKNTSLRLLVSKDAFSSLSLEWKPTTTRVCL